MLIKPNLLLFEIFFFEIYERIKMKQTVLDKYDKSKTNLDQKKTISSEKDKKNNPLIQSVLFFIFFSLLF